MDLDRGKERLENWAAWAKRDDPRLDFPKRSAFAREYQPEAGDVWDGEQMDYPIDDLDAKLVEEMVVCLPIELNRTVRCFYLYRMRVERIAKLDSVGVEAIRFRLDSVADHVGRMALRRAG